MPAKQVVCKDCIEEGITTIRKPATTKAGKPVPGKRCVTHERARKARTKDAAWERRLMETYGITAKEYWMIYEFQGGKCYICQRATGKGRKKLSVDHDHNTGFVRGLLCGPCNRDVVGHLRDDPEAFQRGADYLKFPPAIAVIGRRIAPIELKAA
ncbi:endonuclease VII [Mycobacterium phage Theia]|uniref:Endonuclease VII n=1 Tax=Mycobacterium phage Theia TaxID=1718172 RepID=A0A0N9RUM5_9CAUD|nr:endonuclease VII [Mycobacterium phage Theia]ALH46909.1 endonuclease VII [Mycobacterium phage Theia]